MYQRNSGRHCCLGNKVFCKRVLSEVISGECQILFEAGAGVEVGVVRVIRVCACLEVLFSGNLVRVP